MTSRITLVLVAATLVSRPADADHHGMVMTSSGGGESTIETDLSLVAARYNTTYYGGDYQGVTPALKWSRDRFAASASVGVYRLEENGFRLFGVGDVFVSGQARLVDDHVRHGGVALAVSAPTGDDTHGLGMGHVMVMPSLWGTWMVGSVTLSATAGYCRAISDLGVHVHGMWPLVEPMNMSEIAWGGGAAIAVGYGVQITGRVAGGVPVGGTGLERAVAAVRVDRGNHRMTTGAEIQAGVIGDPFSIRGVVDTAIRF